MIKIIIVIIFYAGCIMFTSCKKAETIGRLDPAPLLHAPYSGPSIFFWTRDSWLNTDPKLNVNINNQTKILDESWAGNGDAGCYPYNGQIKFDLPAGVYTYKTWRQGRDTIRGTVIVKSGNCNSVQINY